MQATSTKEVSFANQSVRKVGKEVVVSVDIEIRKWNPNYRLILTPVIYNGSNELPLESIHVVGKFRHIADQREGTAHSSDHVFRAKDMEKIRYEVKVPYQSWMNEVSVGIEQLTEGCCTVDEQDRLALAENRLLFYQIVPEFNEEIFDYEFTELEQFTLENPFLHPTEDYDQRFELFANDKEKKSVQVYFKQGVSKIDISFGNNRYVLDAIEKAFKLINETPDAQLSKIVIAGFASPEGSEAINNRLAEQRALSVKDFIKTIMTDKNTDHLFEFFNGGKDWDGLLNLLAKSPGLPGREEAIEIIKEYRHQADCNDRLKKINRGTTYAYMLKELYPQLRNAGFVQVYYDIVRTAEIATQITDEEGRTVWIDTESPENLTITRINEATTLMTKGVYDQALQVLMEIREDERSFNHIGVCYMMLEEYDTAEIWLNKALENDDPYAGKNLDHIHIARRVVK